MKAMMYHGNRDLRLETVPDPSPASGEALLQVDYCGICATDIEEYVYGPKFLDKDKMPIITGHEVTATVVDAPDETGRLKAGTRVALNTVLTCGTCFWCGMGETAAVRAVHGGGIRPGRRPGGVPHVAGGRADSPARQRFKPGGGTGRTFGSCAPLRAARGEYDRARRWRSSARARSARSPCRSPRPRGRGSSRWTSSG